MPEQDNYDDEHKENALKAVQLNFCTYIATSVATHSDFNFEKDSGEAGKFADYSTQRLEFPTSFSTIQHPLSLFRLFRTLMVSFSCRLAGFFAAPWHQLCGCDAN
uniref:HDC01137 n=1 Tax=Drosophila melanogaster TaxID=7227 RepID=Q6IHT0_DROME|nr:TPA_inf: HDC01137 [Drosophila melanogaster]